MSLRSTTAVRWTFNPQVAGSIPAAGMRSPNFVKSADRFDSNLNLMESLKNVWETFKSVTAATNHKIIGTLYFTFGAFSGVVGLLLSVLIRLELSSKNSIVFEGNYQLYNTIVTSHGLVMIFFFVTPFLIGGFGN